MNIYFQPIAADPWRPIFMGPTLDQLKTSLGLPYPTGLEARKDREPIRSIALIGAVRDSKTGKLNIRDSALAGSLFTRLSQNFAVQPDCKVEIFNLAENTDIFAARGKWDVLVFCNVRDLTENLVTHYQARKTQNLLPEIKRGQAIEHPHDLDLHLREALISSPTLSGIKFEGIPPEHKNFLRVSEHAIQSDAYLRLAQRLNSKLVLCWGWQHFIHAGHFCRDSRLELTQPDSQPKMQADGYMPANSATLCHDVFADISAEAKAAMPVNHPFVYAIIRHDVLMRMARTDQDMFNPLLGMAFQNYAKLIAKATRRGNLGLSPFATIGDVHGKGLEALEAEAARTPGFIRRAAARVFGL